MKTLMAIGGAVNFDESIIFRNFIERAGETNVAEVEGAPPVAVSGLKVHLLREVCSFDMNRREARIPGIKLK